MEEDRQVVGDTLAGQAPASPIPETSEAARRGRPAAEAEDENLVAGLVVENEKAEGALDVGFEAGAIGAAEGPVGVEQQPVADARIAGQRADADLVVGYLFAPVLFIPRQDGAAELEHVGGL